MKYFKLSTAVEVSLRLMPKIDPPSSALYTSGLWYLSTPTGVKMAWDNVDNDLILLVLEDLPTPTGVEVARDNVGADLVLLMLDDSPTPTGIEGARDNVEDLVLLRSQDLLTSKLFDISLLSLTLATYLEICCFN